MRTAPISQIPGAGRPQSRRLEVDDDEARRLEQSLAGRCRQADAVTAPGKAGIARDDVLEQAPREGHGRVREREERAGRLLGTRPPPLLHQLDEPVGRIERQLHPSDDTRHLSLFKAWEHLVLKQIGGRPVRPPPEKPSRETPSGGAPP